MTTRWCVSAGLAQSPTRREQDEGNTVIALFWQKALKN
jgi:hypothetical protein